MENTTRLKIKIGPHEFEAEGSSQAVNEQFQMFKEMVAAAPASIPTYPRTQSEAPTLSPVSPAANGNEPENADNSLHKIVEHDNDERVVSLTVKPQSVEEAILVMLLAQKWLLANETVTGSAIIDGLKSTGGMEFTRVDRLLEKMGREGNIIVIGERRSKRYRLTNAGITKARTIANDLIFLVP